MIQAALGIIDKMRIEVFDSNDFTKTPKKTIFVQLNPEKYTMKHSVALTDGQAIGASSSTLGFNKIEGEDVTFDFLFDSSGVVPPGKIKDGKVDNPFDHSDDIDAALKPTVVNPLAKVVSVDKEVEEFKKLVMGYNGDTHQTAYLQLLWGGYNLQCRLKSMDIEYYVFAKNGSPIRAKVKCVFKGTVSYKMMLAQQNKTSPDITHMVTVTDGDTLPQMAHNVYDSPSYYVDVAKYNNLGSFRKLKTGTRLVFPPVK